MSTTSFVILYCSDLGEAGNIPALGMGGGDLWRGSASQSV